MSAGHLTPKARKLTAWGASPRRGVWTFRGQISGRCAKCRQGDWRGGIQKINEAQRKAKRLGGMTHHMNGGRPGRQARSRAQGSIGVPPVFPIRVQDDDQKLAERTSPRSHSPICSRHSETQARRLCYLGLGVMPPLRPVGESSLLKMSKLQAWGASPRNSHKTLPSAWRWASFTELNGPRVCIHRTPNAERPLRP